jgi:hypothetical protein
MLYSNKSMINSIEQKKRSFQDLSFCTKRRPTKRAPDWWGRRDFQFAWLVRQSGVARPPPAGNASRWERNTETNE